MSYDNLKDKDGTITIFLANENIEIIDDSFLHIFSSYEEIEEWYNDNHAFIDDTTQQMHLFNEEQYKEQCYDIKRYLWVWID